MWSILRRKLTRYEFKPWRAAIKSLEDAMEIAENEDPIDEWTGSCFDGFESYRDRSDFRYMYRIERDEQQD